MPEAITVNGVNILTLATMVETGTPLLSGAPLRGEDLVVPGRDGRLPVTRRWYDQTTFTLPMWIKGIDPVTGLVPGGSDAMNEFYKRADTMTQLFAADAQPFDIIHTRTDGQQRQALCRLAGDPIAFTRDKSSPMFGRFGVALTIPDASWRDAAAVTPQTISSATGATQTWTNFLGATARMTDLVLTFGPGSNPALTQGGVSFSYGGVIAAGRKLVVDCGTWDVTGTIDAGGTWTPTFSAIAHAGDARFFVLAPNKTPGSSPQTVLTHTGGGSMSVTLAGRRRYGVG